MRIKVQSLEEAQEIVRRRVKAEFGSKVEVNFLKTTLETDLSNGKKLWLVEGNIQIRRWLFLKRVWHFTYFVNAEDGRILIMRVKRG